MSAGRGVQWLSVVGVVATALAGVPALAESIEFDMTDPKGVHNISFVADSMLEPIMGLASGISGTLQFDPKHPKATTGHIVVQSASLHIANTRMKEVLHSADWLDVAGYPTIEFTFESIKKAKKLGKGRFQLKAEGEFTCKGKTKKIKVPVVITYLPDKLGRRLRGMDGDMVVVRSEFSIKRSDFGIKPNMGSEVVAEEIELRVALVGTHRKAG